MSGQGNCGVCVCVYIYMYSHTMEYYSAMKVDYLDICANANGPYVHYAKWNKSDGERQIPCDITFMWNIKQQKKTNKQKKSSLIQRMDWWLPEAECGDSEK